MLYAARGDFEPRRHLPGTASLLPPPRFEGFESWAQGSALLRDLDPVAVIAPLSPALADSTDYLDFLLACARRSADDPAFRLYVHLSGATPGELTAAAAENPALGGVIDTVHISMASEEATLGEIDEALGHFLSSLQDIRDAERYRRILLWLWTPLGLAEVPMLAGAVLAAAATVGSAALQKATGAPFPLAEPVRTVVSVGVGAALSLLGLCLVFARGWRFGAAVLAGIVIVCAIRTSTPPNPLFLGVVAALALDYLRRSWAALLPVSLSFSETQVPRSLAECRPVCWLARMLGGPIRPLEPQAFISYARRTWADDLAKTLRTRVTAGGLNCFLDIQDIELGSCWRHALESGIRNCTVFLFFDQAEPGRPPRIWHRAELYTASLMRRRTGLPHIALLTPAGQAAQPLAFYRQRLPDLADLGFQIIPISPEQVDQLAGNLVRSPSPPVVTGIHAVFYPLSPIPCFVGNYGFNVGSFVIPPLFVLHGLRGGFLPPWLWAALALVGWLSAGFGLRAVLHERFEALAGAVRQAWAMQLIQLTLLLGALVIGSPWRHAEVSPWGPVFLLVGFNGLDILYRTGRSGFKFGSRSVTDRV